ncbi:MAG TPA: hypothetical protein PKA63_00830 [Oligoflexia bacterium]|nr:hypothetical protein [Oligoflexia bacterium]HMP47194.1 hypothetical protein [Oligoflexia bacterium]
MEIIERAPLDKRRANEVPTLFDIYHKREVAGFVAVEICLGTNTRLCFKFLITAEDPNDDLEDLIPLSLATFSAQFTENYFSKSTVSTTFEKIEKKVPAPV